MVLSCQSLSVSLAMPTNLISRDHCIFLYGTITILPDDIILMTRHNGVFLTNLTRKHTKHGFRFSSSILETLGKATSCIVFGT